MGPRPDIKALTPGPLAQLEHLLTFSCVYTTQEAESKRGLGKTFFKRKMSVLKG